MLSIFRSRAEWRALIGAVLIGSGAGLGLGVLYLAGELNHRAAEYARVEAIAEAALADYDETQAATPSRATGAAPDPRVERKLAKKDARARELTCLTDAVYYEARSEDAAGQRAVAQVVMNRVKHPAFPKSVCGVVFQGAAGRRGCQFSFACDGSMHARREEDAWKKARRIAARALAGAVAGEVGSATHYHNLGVSPAWSGEMRRVAQVGAHVFYRFSPKKAAAMRAAAQAATAEQVVLTSAPLRAAELRVTPAPLEAPEPMPAPPESDPAADAAAKPVAAAGAGS